MPISPSGRAAGRLSETLAITLGDPTGIGPEVALKALGRLPAKDRSSCFLIGPAAFYRTLAGRLGLKLDLNCVFDRPFPKKIKYGRSDNEWTRLAAHSIKLAASMAMRGEVDAIVTPPIHKAGMKKAGLNIPGHTEYLAELSGAKHFEMMLVGGKLRVVLVTRHESIKNVPRLLTKNRVEETILTADRELRRSFGIRRPRLVVCGLNPHAGEEGTIGREETQIIRPAVLAAKKKTDAVIAGPLSPDALFHDAYHGAYDAEICMYHDQGLIPLKMISRGSGVNVTLGLPFVRTSPDHGTGYDIAGKFRADPGSMLEAIRLAALLSRNRKKYAQSHPGS
ncbi:MAG: 4-hydroxythreonine-4-phosphate dehydrogenase PdxA [Candidatus Omnitrophica bacterium]|nr:4-hydroxythreonine-4-phosphate dehydrogenase PdxA [Candidatus Omnitrophota bacterium]